MNIDNKISSDTRPAPTQPAQPGSLDLLRAACACCYHRMLHRLAAVKARIEGEFGQAMAGYEQLLNAAVNEAEAVAWQTPYPHLFFPVLAEEKAAEARQWAAQQLEIRERTSPGHPQFQLAA